jgi:hypothetical protein
VLQPVLRAEKLAPSEARGAKEMGGPEKNPTT